MFKARYSTSDFNAALGGVLIVASDAGICEVPRTLELGYSAEHLLDTVHKLTRREWRRNFSYPVKQA